MTNSTEQAELFLSVELENAYNDGAELSEPNYQLLSIPQYTEQYITALLAKARYLYNENNALKRQLGGSPEIPSWGWQGLPSHEGGNSSWIDDEPF